MSDYKPVDMEDIYRPNESRKIARRLRRKVLHERLTKGCIVFFWVVVVLTIFLTGDSLLFGHLKIPGKLF